MNATTRARTKVNRPKYRGDCIEKHYHRESLLSTPSEQQQRWQLIEKLSISIPAFPETTLSIDSTELRVCQHRIRRNKLDEVPMAARYGLLSDLAVDLDVMLGAGFVHGDINRKNIMFDGERLRLVDLEPDLFQERDGVKTIMVTSPYIAASDLRLGTVSAATDRIGFACFCRIWGREELRPLRPGELVKKRRAEDVSLMQDMPDADVENLQFIAIAEAWAYS